MPRLHTATFIVFIYVTVQETRSCVWFRHQSDRGKPAKRISSNISGFEDQVTFQTARWVNSAVVHSQAISFNMVGLWRSWTSTTYVLCAEEMPALFERLNSARNFWQRTAVSPLKMATEYVHLAHFFHFQFRRKAALCCARYVCKTTVHCPLLAVHYSFWTGQDFLQAFLAGYSL